MAKATGKKPTSNLYSLLLQPDLEGFEADSAPKSAKGKKPEGTDAAKPAPSADDGKKLAEKQTKKPQQQSKADNPEGAPATKPKLNRDEWEKNKASLQASNDDGFKPARPPKKETEQPQSVTNTPGDNYRGGRGGGGRRGGRGGYYNNNDNQSGGRGGYYNNDNQTGGRGGYYNNDNQGGGRGGRFNNDNQGGRGGDSGRGGRRGGRGGRGGGRGRFNRNLDDQPRLEENTNREVNQRGEDLTGETTPRKRQYDRKSGRFVTNYGNSVTGAATDFAPAEWVSTAPTEAATPEASAEGWGDNADADPAAAWDAVNQGMPAAPTSPNYSDNKSKTEKKPPADAKPKPPPQKSLEEHLAEQQQKKKEVTDLLLSKGLSVASPRAEPTEAEPKPKSAKSSKPAPVANQKTQMMETLFKFESNRANQRFTVDNSDSIPDDPPPGYENTTPRRGGRRGGRRNQGGRNTGGGYGNYSDSTTAAQVVAANAPQQYYDPSSVTREDEWPTLV